MSEIVAQQLTRELEKVTTDLAWREWSAIGGSATVGKSLLSIVDPEALVLASLFLADREPRLTNVLFSWVELNASLLSVQRMKNLQKDYPIEVHDRVAKFANETRTLAKHPRWRSLAPHDGTVATAIVPEVSRAINAPSNVPSNLMLRLRLGFGVGTKADVMAVALGSDVPRTIKELSDALSYTAVGIRSAVGDLERAGFLVEAGGRPAAYSATRSDWSALLHIKTLPQWVGWHQWFALIVDLITSIDHASKKKLGDYALDVRIREVLARHPLFFRNSANELSAVAFLDEKGSYPYVLGALASWASGKVNPNQ